MCAPLHTAAACLADKSALLSCCALVVSLLASDSSCAMRGSCQASCIIQFACAGFAVRVHATVTLGRQKVGCVRPAGVISFCKLLVVVVGLRVVSSPA